MYGCKKIHTGPANCLWFDKTAAAAEILIGEPALGTLPNEGLRRVYAALA